jgi:hypothetical protein
MSQIRENTETKIITNYNILGEVNNPILVIHPNGKEEMCSSVDIHGSSTVTYDRNIVYTITDEHVVLHIALEDEEIGKKKVKYQPGMVSAAGVEHINPDTEELDFEID